MNTNLFGWSDLFWQRLDQLSTLFGFITSLLTIAGVILAIVKREKIRRWLAGNRFPNTGGELPSSMSCDGLVFTVSKSELPIWVLDMQTVKPRVVCLIATRQSRDAADSIERRAKELGIEDVRIYLVNNPDDPNESRRVIQQALDYMHTQGLVSIAVDVTGGKTPMSLGAFMAAEESRCTTLYVTADYAEGKPIPATARIIALSRHQ